MGSSSIFGEMEKTRVGNSTAGKTLADTSHY